MDERKDVTIRAPAARAGGKAPAPGAADSGIHLPGAVVPEILATHVQREPELKIATDAEVVTDLVRDVKRLEAEKKTLQYACSTISTTAAALLLMLMEMGVQSGVDEVTIPQEFIDKATNGRIDLTEAEDGVKARVTTRIDRDFAIGD